MLERTQERASDAERMEGLDMAHTHDHRGLEHLEGHHTHKPWSKYKVCDGGLVLSTSYQDISNCFITLPIPGDYLITVTLAVNCTADAGGGDAIVGQLTDSGGAAETGDLGHLGIVVTAVSALTTSRTWPVTTTVPSVVRKLRARRTGAGGTLNVAATDTAIHAVLLEKP
jgi:hypothetical protein